MQIPRMLNEMIHEEKKQEQLRIRRDFTRDTECFAV